MADESVRVEGLKEFVRELRKIEPEMGRAMRKVHKDIADEVAEQTRASFSGRSGVAPKVAGSVRALAQQNRAQIAIGGDRYPFAMGSEFGSVAYKQFPPWRGSDSGAGYSLYPTLRRLRERNENRFLEAVEQATRSAFPD